VARPLRIESTGALYHVTSRGDGREAIYGNDEERRQFLAVLGQVGERFNWAVHAYCLMDNHSGKYGAYRMTEYPAPKMSALCQSVTRDGKTVQIDIYEDGNNAWLLEVIDEHGNSTVWDDPFSTEQGALDEVLKTIEEEGIDALIGSE